MLWAATFFATMAVAASGQLCQPLSRDGLLTLAKAQEETKVVFFASWCSDCKESLVAKQPPGTIFVATFDERPAAERVIKAMGVKAPCYLDNGLADHLGIKAVPAAFVFDKAGQVKSRSDR